MITKLEETSNGLALVLEKPLLEQLGINETTELEISISDDVLVIAPVRDKGRQEKLKRILDDLDRKYGGLFRRLAD